MRLREIVKLIGEFLFLTALVWCVAVSDAASVHKRVFWGILVCGAVLGGLQAVWGRAVATPLPVSVVSRLLEWIRSWIPSHDEIHQANHKGDAEPVTHGVDEVVVGTTKLRGLSSSNSTHSTLTATIKVRLLFLDEYREFVGRGEMIVPLPEAMCVADLVAHLRTNGLSRLPTKPVVVVNMDYATLATTLKDGDQVAFLPPVR